MYKIKLPNVSNTWHDKDYLLLESSFQLLVDFVEVECAWAEQCIIDYTTNHELAKNYPIIYKVKSLLRNKWRSLINYKPSVEYGIQFLQERRLKELESYDKNNTDDPQFKDYLVKDLVTSQQILELYNWWKARDQDNIKREIQVENKLLLTMAKLIRNYNLQREPKPDDEEFLSVFGIFRLLDVVDRAVDNDILDPTDREYYLQVRHNYLNLSNMLYEEDTEQLIKLVKLRGYLWS